MNPGKIPVSVLIPTRNEERNIPACLMSVSWSNDVVLLDSHSTDQTLALAQSAGATVHQRQFDNFADHKNWALDHIPFKNEWICLFDADERCTPALAEEIARVVAETPVFNGFYIARQNYFRGRWIRHGGWYPNWNLRLLRRDRGRYESRIVHEHILLDGPAGFLKNPMIHYDDKGIERYFERHNTYSSMEAIEIYRLLSSHSAPRFLPATLWARGPERRRFLKNWAYRHLPCRTLIKFLWMYVIRLGFLDGRLGFRYCLLHSIYEYQISLKLEELSDPESPMRQKYNKIINSPGEAT